jgi:group I intron endonuclease
MLYFLVYKTINLVNGKYYIGAHRTKNLQDGYLGSGELLIRAFAKYGKENFKKDIIKFCSCKQEMLDLEIELIAVALGDPLCYNIKEGGEGGFDYIRKHHLNPKPEIGARGGRKLQWLIHNDLEIREKYIAGVKKRRSQVAQLHTEEVYRKHSESVKGEANSQFGSRWLKKEGKEIKARSWAIEKLLTNGWEFGRINFPPSSRLRFTMPG